MTVKDAPWGPCQLSLHGSPRRAVCPELKERQLECTGNGRRWEAPGANLGFPALCPSLREPGCRTAGDFVCVCGC